MQHSLSPPRITRHSAVLAVLVTILVTLSMPAAWAQTPLNGNVSGTLTLADSPYLVTSSFNVGASATLVVEAGVEIRFGLNAFATVTGTWITQGTAGSNVLLTSAVLVPEPGDWVGVYVQNGAVVDLDHTWIEYAGASNLAGLITTSGNVADLSWDGGGSRLSANDGARVAANVSEFRNLLFEDNLGDGLEVSGSATPPVFDTIEANGNGGIAMRVSNNAGSFPASLQGAGNGTNGVYVTGNLGGSVADQTWTWGAATDFPIIINTITVGSGDVLQVEAGAVVKFFAPTSFLQVLSGGHLETTGGADVWFTSLADDANGGDTNGDGLSSGTPGDWQCIYLQNGSTAFLRDAFFAYGGGANLANLVTTSGRMASLDWQGGGCSFSANDGARLLCNEARISGLVVDGNTNEGLEIGSLIPVELADISASVNGGYAISLPENPGNLPASITGSGNGANGVYVNGNLSGTVADAAWTWRSGPTMPVIIGTVSVASGDTLTVAGGTVAKFASTTSWLQVNSGGVFNTIESGDIWFTSLADDAHGGDTNNNGGATAPQGGDWQTVYLQNGAVADLTDTWFAYGGGGSLANVVTTSGRVDDLQWDGGGLVGSANDGARIITSTASLANLTLEDNALDGLEINSTTPAVLDAITANDNGGAGLRLTTNPGDVPGNMAGSGNGINGTVVNGTLGGATLNGTWTWGASTDFPVIIDNVTVNSADTLDVAAGAVVKFLDAGAWLNLSGGALTSPAGDPTWFTSLADDAHGGDTNNDGDATAPLGGDWTTVYVQNGSSMMLNDTWFAYGGGSNLANLVTTSGRAAEVTWNGGGLVGSANDGARLITTTSSLANLNLENNDNDGLEIDSSVPAVLDAIMAIGNGEAGLRLTTNPGSVPANMSGYGNGVNGTVVVGTLGGTTPDATWTWGASPGFPVVVDNVSVPTGDILEVAPGSVVKFHDAAAWLSLSGGTLNVPSGGASTWFTSLADDAHGGDTNNDGGATSPAGGDWTTVYVQNGSSVDLNDTWFGYGGNSNLANLVTTSGRAVDFIWQGGGSVMSEADGARVSVQTAQISGVQFLHNTLDGLELNASVNGSADNCEFVGNGGLALRNSAGSSLTITSLDSWWGDASGPFDPTDGNPDYNPAGLGGQVSDYVDYRPWAPAASGNQAPGDFELLTPVANYSVTDGEQTFSWEAALDPDGDTVNYTLEFSSDGNFDGPTVFMRRGGLSSAHAVVDIATLPMGISYWRVVARDGRFGLTVSTPGSRVFNRGVPTSADDLGPGNRFAFAARPSWPNPSNAVSNFSFTLPGTQTVDLRVYNVAGRLVRTLVSGTIDRGQHSVTWDGRDRTGARVATGVYFYRLQAESGQLVRRVVMIR